MVSENLQNRNEVKEVKFHHKVKRFYHKNLFRKIYTVAIIGLVVANIVSMVKYSSLADDLYVKGEGNNCSLLRNDSSEIRFEYGSYVNVYECGGGSCRPKKLYCDDSGEIYEGENSLGTSPFYGDYYTGKCSVTVDENSPREYGFGYSSSDFYWCADGECNSDLSCEDDGYMKDGEGNSYSKIYTSYCELTDSTKVGQNYNGDFYECEAGVCDDRNLTCDSQNGGMIDREGHSYYDIYSSKCSVTVNENSTKEYGFRYSSSGFYGCSDGECESKSLSCDNDGYMKDGEGNSYSKIYTSYCELTDSTKVGQNYNGDFYECEAGVCDDRNLTCDSQNGGMKDGVGNSYIDNIYSSKCSVTVDESSSREYGFGFSISDFYECEDGECESKSLSCDNDGYMKDGEGNSYDKIYAGRCSINIDGNTEVYGYGSNITILPNVSSSPVMVGCDTDGVFKDENGTSYDYGYKYKEKFAVTFAASPEGYGSVDQATVTVDEGTAVQINDNTVTLGTEIVTATPTADTQQYDYSFVNWTNNCGDTVSDNCSIVASFSRTDIIPVPDDSTPVDTTPSYSGRGGRNSSSNKDSHNSADDKNTSVDKNETKASEENKSQIITDNTDSQKSSYTESKGQKVPEIDMQRYNTMYTPEQNTAYQFAYHNKITTVPTIKEAKMNTPLTRIEMAKMLSYYAMNVLGQTPDHGAGVVNFKDVSSKLDAQYDNAVTLAYQLGIMGINMPNNEFRPYDKVTRAEFATALSRMIYEMEDGTGRLKYYEPHIARLYNEGIINVTNPKMLELRGNVMMMLMRTEK